MHKLTSMGIAVPPKTIVRFETNLADDNIFSQAVGNIIIPNNISARSFVYSGSS